MSTSRKTATVAIITNLALIAGLLVGDKVATFAAGLVWVFVVLGVLALVGMMADDKAKEKVRDLYSSRWKVARSVVMSASMVVATIYAGYPVTAVFYLVVSLALWGYAWEVLHGKTADV